MNLHGLLVFHHVAEKGGVTKAAETLRISQPAVTAHVRNLGRELGLPLLAPKGRGVLLTEAGERVAGHAARLFALQREIERDLDAFRAGQSGALRIAATSLPANYLLPECLARYRGECPGVFVALTTLNAREAMRALLLYEADLAFIGGGAEPPAGLVQRLLLEDELWFIVRAGHPLAGQTVPLERMAQEPFVMREPGSAAREKLLSLCRVKGVRPPRTALQVSGMHETVRAAAAGFGAAFVSSLEAKEAAAAGEIARVRVDGAELFNPVALVTRADDPLPPPAARFAALLTGGGQA
ncbi:LysR substrate-binding domain-containing protein [Paenibacillus humicola]|uniref:LysR substrate-binding domain-containing protein n=1 Tax=Paenibacillus humicola TaxID=3110540 RepID=UPI00237A1878|nr:LysR substrate-binding domain-containing protein [Paenibacillus humicola]